MSGDKPKNLTGGCLCGGVRYEITGPCRDVINCHCQNCRRTHGHIGAYTSARQSDLKLIERQTLQWYHDRSPDTWRGFCNQCGASLFWDARDGRGKMAIAAGSLDAGDNLQYYEINDGLPQYETGNDGALESGDGG
jgi:hypothetical protein